MCFIYGWYTLRIKTYSMNTILTFDAHRRIRYLVVGWPGSVHDSTIWKTTDVFKQPHLYFSSEEYQLGDSGFAMTHQMVVPYRQPYSRDVDNAEFNTYLASARAVSEHGNGILKGDGKVFEEFLYVSRLPRTLKGFAVGLWRAASFIIFETNRNRQSVRQNMNLSSARLREIIKMRVLDYWRK
ncbi:hypothetical protein Ae201684_013384 [Aphanomyces euteiches]|uniref:DDE Tnp4 domain-containing protein n=1 Tax=Aphanomyces euteiches TaxID=100861 RepID=A0A6G0WNA9_9STRA|nr:hypothetical protein Ae201684_013384 [Aphanomyces euteiches]